MTNMRCLLLLICLAVTGCDGAVDPSVDMGIGPDMGVFTGRFGITEFMAKNEGAWVDEAGETDDWIEIHNGLKHAI